MGKLLTTLVKVTGREEAIGRISRMRPNDPYITSIH
jgi:hypothetical protein